MKLSLMDILNESKGKLLYSAVVLDEVSRKQLISFVKDFVLIPSEWRIINHHMTIGFKKPVPDELKDYIGKNIDLRVKEIGVSDDAIAVKVEGFFTYNERPKELDSIARKSYAVISGNSMCCERPCLTERPQSAFRESPRFLSSGSVVVIGIIHAK